MEKKQSYNVEDRVNGELPIIKIAGETFEIDIYRHELALKSNPTIKINLHKMGMVKEGTKLVGFYNPSSYEIVDIDYPAAALPKGFVILETPNEYRLDPIGFAIRWGIHDKGQLQKFCKERNTRIKTYPVKDLKKILNMEDSLKSEKSIKRGRGRSP